MKWAKKFRCSWLHCEGHIKRDPQGRLNWQCKECGYWSDPVPIELQMLNDMEFMWQQSLLVEPPKVEKCKEFRGLVFCPEAVARALESKITRSKA